MLICTECEALFEQAKVMYETHGLDSPPYEELLLCPCCGGSNIHHTHRCDVCGEWITGSYIKTLAGNRICENCCITRDIEKD